MNRTLRICISVLLSAMMLVTIIQLPNRVSATNQLSDNSTEIKSVYAESKEKESLITNETELVPIDSFHKMLNSEDVEKFGHIGRSEEHEASLNSLVMKNSDGTLTTYIFSEDIKYVDESGNIKDKETLITKVTDEAYTTKYAYATTNNDVQVLFPKSLGEENGVLLGKNDIRIELKPILSALSVLRSVQADDLSGSKTTFEPTKSQISEGNEAHDLQDVIDYTNVFAVNTILRYTPTLNGFKEDIVISEYTGVNEFSFSLKTNGLKLAEDNGSYYLVDPDTLQKKVVMGSLVVYDGDGIISSDGYLHQYEVTTVSENSEYIIKIIIDREYLEDESTVYPITVDPSFEILSEENNILDISVRANGIVYNDSVNNGVGNHYVLLEDMRTFIKFPGLLSDPMFEEFAPPGYGQNKYREIQSIKLQMYSRGTSMIDTQVRVYSYDTSSSLNWTYNTTNFTSTQFNALGSLQTSTTVPYGFAQWVEFDITGAAYNGANGIVLVNQYEGSGNDPVYQSFASTKDADYKPRIVVTWTGDDNTSFDTAVSIENDTVYDVSVPASGSKKYYSFTPSSTRFYKFESTDRGNADPYVWIYNDSQVLLTSNDDGAGNRNFKATYHLELGKTYYIAAGCFGTGTGTYSMTVTDSTDLTNLNTTVITTTTTGLASILSAQQKSYFKFTPTVSSYYTIASSNSTSDPYGWIYKESGQYITKNDDGSSGRDFTICTYLESGKTYYIVGGCYGTNTDTYTVSVAVTTPLAPSNLTVSNVTGNSMNLSWNVPSAHYANRWLIQMSVNNGEWSNYAVTTSNNYSVTGLAASKKYDFRVYGEAGGPAWSGTRSLSSSNTATATTLPAQPTNLTASNITGNSVHLTWDTASPHGADRWRVEYVIGTQGWQKVTDVTSKSLTINNLSASTLYAFRVFGERDNDDGSKTYSIVSETFRVKTLPAQPTDLNVTSKTGNSVSFTWSTASPHGADRWRIEYVVGNQGWQEIDTVTSKSFTMNNLSASTVYAFRVFGERDNDDGTTTDSVVSSTLRIITLSAQPTGLAASNITSDSVTLTWNTASPHGADRWLIQYRTSGGTWTDYDTSTSKSCNVTGLSANTAYEFRVYGERYATETWPGEYSLVSNTATATTLSTNVLHQRILDNLSSGSSIHESKKSICLEATKLLLERDYEPAFIAGVLGNICHEGEPGLFEYYNSVTPQSYLVNLNGYLENLEQPTTYIDAFHGKYIYDDMDLDWVYDIFTYLNNIGWEIDDNTQSNWGIGRNVGNAIGVGLGSVGWTFGRTYNLINIYRETCNYRSKITLEETLAAEAKLIILEICENEYYSSIYTDWLQNNSSYQNTTAATDACYRICAGYERPYFTTLDENYDGIWDDFSNHEHYIWRYNSTCNIYNEMFPPETSTNNN